MSVVLVDRPSPGVALVKINRPEAKNALNTEVRQLLAEHFAALGQDPEVRCIVLTGNEAAFAAGADLRELSGSSSLDVFLRRVHLLWQAIARCPKPVIAAVNGYAWGGGCELAMHADIIIAGESASFAQPEVKVGIMPGAGGTQRLLRAIGKYQTMKLILTGQAVSGREAYAMGLASDVVDDDKVLPTALKLADQISKMPPLAVEQMKEVVLAGQDAPLETALMLERKAFQLLFDSKDQKEGMAAFFEKRKPEYQGR